MHRPQLSHGHRSRSSRASLSPPRVDLTLYVADQTPRSILAIANCTDFCEAHLPGQYRLTIIDIYQHPAVAKRENIVAVPTLVKHRGHSAPSLVR
jgi:circadian clock protein KaiB